MITGCSSGSLCLIIPVEIITGTAVAVYIHIYMYIYIHKPERLAIVVPSLLGKEWRKG